MTHHPFIDSLRPSRNPDMAAAYKVVLAAVVFVGAGLALILPFR